MAIKNDLIEVWKEVGHGTPAGPSLPSETQSVICRTSAETAALECLSEH